MRNLGWRSASPTTENGNGNTSDRRELEVDPGWWLPFRPKSSRAIGRRRLAQCGTPDFKLWKSAILEALDQHQVALLHAV